MLNGLKVLASQPLHLCIVWQIGPPFSRRHNLRSAKCTCGLLEKLGLYVKFNLIEDEDLGGDKPGCETNHKRAERERPPGRHRRSRAA